MVRWDALLVLDLGLDVVDGVRGLDIEGDGLPWRRGGCVGKRGMTRCVPADGTRKDKSRRSIELTLRRDGTCQGRSWSGRGSHGMVGGGAMGGGRESRERNNLVRVSGKWARRMERWNAVATRLTRQGLDKYLHGHQLSLRKGSTTTSGNARRTAN